MFIIGWVLTVRLKILFVRQAVVSTKAMRLPKNFGISRKSKVESRIVSTVENRPKLSRLYFAFDFRESVTETTETLTENAYRKYLPKIYRNFQNMSKMTNITGIFEN